MDETASLCPKRREFMQKLGMALGGVVLAGGSSSTGYGQTSIPNAYNFYRVVTANDGAKYGAEVNPIGELTAAVMLGSSPTNDKTTLSNFVYVHGVTTNGARAGQPVGLFQIGMDYSQSKPQ